jgi:MFS family permease
MNEFSPVIHNKSFRYLWISQLTSQLTINMMNFLLLTRLFSVTGSPIATSFLWIAYALPALIIGPFASATVDMFPRRKMLIWTNLLQAVTIFVYAILQQNSLFLLYGTVFIYSLLNQFYVPAEAASVPSLVPKDYLPQANSLFFLTQQGSMIVGFTISGLISQAFGYENALLICALSVFVAYISTNFLPDMRVENKIPKKFEDAVMHFFTNIFGGYEFIKNNRVVLIPYLLLFGLQITLSVLVVSLPAIAKEIFAIPLNSAGLIIVAPAGIGAVIGAISVSKLLKRGWRKKAAIELFMMLTCLMLLLINFVLPELTNGVRIIAGPVMVMFLGLSALGVLIPTQTFLQEIIPGGLRGRVFGNFWFITTAASIVPVIFSGTITELLGTRTLFLVIAVLGVIGLFFSKKYGQGFLEDRYKKGGNV